MTGCSSPTATDPLVVSLRPLILATDVERAAWPGTPTVLGGGTIRVRGTAYVGCGRARAERRGDFVGIAISAVDTDRPCPANISAWRPFEAEVSGLPPASYRVRATVVGHEGHATWRVTVADI